MQACRAPGYYIHVVFDVGSLGYPHRHPYSYLPKPLPRHGHRTRAAYLWVWVPTLAQRCRKQSRTCLQSPSHMLPTTAAAAAAALALAFIFTISCVVARSGGECRGWDRAGGRRGALVGGGDSGDGLDRLRDAEAEGRERWGRAEEPRPGIRWRKKRDQACAQEGELRQVRDVDVEGRREGQAGRHAERIE